MSYQEVHEIIDRLDISDSWKNKFKEIHSIYNLNYLNGEINNPWFWKPRAEFKSLNYTDKGKFEYSANGWAFLLGPLYYMGKGLWLEGLIILIIAMALPKTYLFIALYCYYSANFDFFRKKLLKSEIIKSNPNILDNSYDKSLFDATIQKPTPLSIKLFYIMIVLFVILFIYFFAVATQ